MRLLKYTTLALAFFGFSAEAQLSFIDSAYKVIEITPVASTGLETLYVVEYPDDIIVSYKDGDNVKWSKFGSAGAAYAEEIGVFNAITLTSEDCGIIVETDGRQHCYWIVNYKNHELKLNSITPAADQQDCQRIELNVDGNGERINYFTINGRSVELSRELKLSYKTLEFDADNNDYRQKDVVEELSHLSSTLSTEAPYCNTQFILSGDRFLETWGRGVRVESPTVEARAVTASTSAEQHTRENDNEQSSNVASLGGSAPCEIDFTAAISDAVSFYEWQLSKTSDFDVIDDRYPQTDFSYTFRDYGTTYVRFFAADASGVCQFTGDIYEVVIGESRLECPNAFTPESSPGVNDEWKVSYKSIVSFECHIFNRWGTEMCSFTDPALGWDGKYKGKYVPSGTYYYVIKAKGSDGRQYNLSGDINIIGSKNINTQNSESSE